MLRHTFIAFLVLNTLLSASSDLERHNELAQALTDGLKEMDQQESALIKAPSDTTSTKLLKNSKIVIGAQSGIKNIVAYGTFDYGDDPKEYQLVETADGRRALTMKWTYMGRPYTETIVSVPKNIAQADAPDLWRIITKAIPGKDGRPSEERVYLKMHRGREVLQEERFGHTVISYNTYLREKQLSAEDWRVIGGDYAERSTTHFQTVPLFMHDFINREVTGCKFIGMEKLAKRDVYVIRRGSESFYYIDKEKFLLLQWGRKEVFGTSKLEVAYMANAFKRWNGPSGPILLPSKISVVAKGQTLGSYSVDRIEINKQLDPSMFEPPQI